MLTTKPQNLNRMNESILHSTSNLIILPYLPRQMPSETDMCISSTLCNTYNNIYAWPGAKTKTNTR